MIKRLFDWLRQPLGLIAVGIVLLAVFSFAAYGISLTQQAPEQPIQFPHDKHVGFRHPMFVLSPWRGKGTCGGHPIAGEMLGVP